MDVDFRDYDLTKKRPQKRALCVMAVLEIFKTEAAAGNMVLASYEKANNPIEKYADLIEEALKIKDNKA